VWRPQAGSRAFTLLLLCFDQLRLFFQLVGDLGERTSRVFVSRSFGEQPAFASPSTKPFCDFPP
jgi:hypothetical protein